MIPIRNTGDAQHSPHPRVPTLGLLGDFVLSPHPPVPTLGPGGDGVSSHEPRPG
jgi:hypothetical protein